MTIYKQGKIFVFHSRKEFLQNSNENIQYIYSPMVDNKLDIAFILNKLYNLGIMSVLVEAGGRLNNSFLPYVDRLYHFIAPKILGDNNGKSCFYGKEVEKISNCTNLNFESVELFPPDILVNYVK